MVAIAVLMAIAPGSLSLIVFRTRVVPETGWRVVPEIAGFIFLRINSVGV